MNLIVTNTKTIREKFYKKQNNNFYEFQLNLPYLINECQEISNQTFLIFYNCIIDTIDIAKKRENLLIDSLIIRREPIKPVSYFFVIIFFSFLG